MSLFDGLGKLFVFDKKGGNRTGKQAKPGKSHSDREDKPKRGGENHSQRPKSSGSKTGGRGN